MALRTSLVAQPHLYIGDTTGRPLDGGKVYFGQVNKDPELYPINVFYDEALSVAAPQPVRTKGGFMYANGDMAEIYAVETRYSVKVLDSYGRQVFYKPDMQSGLDVSDKVSSIEQMIALIGAVNGTRVYLSGTQGGMFIYDSSKSAINDGVVTFNGWVRQISNGITPEMAGAKGDGATNDLTAFEKCLEYGGKILLDNSKEYFLELSGMGSYKDREFLVTNNSVQLIGVGKGRAKVIFKHDAPNGSPASLIIKHKDGEGHVLGNILAHIEFLGNPIRGITDKTKRARGVNMTGADGFIVSNCKFSTMQTHSLGIGRVGGTDWFDITNPDSANTAESVLALQALSSKNGLIENCEVEHVGSNGLAIFGGSNIKVDGYFGEMDLTARFNNIILVDDASDYTPLENYSINDNIHVSRVVSNGRIASSGLASGSITDCSVGEISVTSYDFNQQVNNFGKAPNTNGTSTHLTKPFLWMDYIERGVQLEGNIVNTLYLSSAYVDVKGNFLRTTKSDDKLITLANNGVKWTDAAGGSYFDNTEPSASIGISDNTFTIGHTGATLVGYDAAAATSNAVVLDNTIKLINGITAYTYHQTTSVRVKKTSSIIDIGNTVTKDINHHVNVGQGLLTQGVNSNFIKTFANILGRATGQQDIVAFTASTSNVYITLNILDELGRVIRKKLTVAPDNTVTLTDLDGGSLLQSGVFGVKSLADGSRILYVVAFSVSLCIDITGVVKHGTGTFLTPPSRSRLDG